MSIAVIDHRRRIVLPKDVAEELEASEGDIVLFEKRGGNLVVVKASSKRERLEEIMSWDPKRTGKIERVSPRAMKEIWKT